MYSCNKEVPLTISSVDDRFAVDLSLRVLGRSSKIVTAGPGPGHRRSPSLRGFGPVHRRSSSLRGFVQLTVEVRRFGDWTAHRRSPSLRELVSSPSKSFASGIGQLTLEVRRFGNLSPHRRNCGSARWCLLGASPSTAGRLFGSQPNSACRELFQPEPCHSSSTSSSTAHSMTIPPSSEFSRAEFFFVMMLYRLRSLPVLLLTFT